MRSKKATAVASWPRIDVDVNDDGTGQVRIAGSVAREISSDDAEGARQVVTEQLAETARQLGRAVQATVRDPQGTWTLTVDPAGTVRSADLAPIPAARGARKGRSASARVPASRKREGAELPGRGVPPTGQVRDPRPPFTDAASGAAVTDTPLAAPERPGETERAAAAFVARRQAAAAAAERVRREEEMAADVDAAGARCAAALTEMATALGSAQFIANRDRVEGDEEAHALLVVTITDAEELAQFPIPAEVDAAAARTEAVEAHTRFLVARGQHLSTIRERRARAQREQAERERMRADREQREQAEAAARAEAARLADELTAASDEHRAAAAELTAAARSADAVATATVSSLGAPAAVAIEEAVAAAYALVDDQPENVAQLRATANRLRGMTAEIRAACAGLEEQIARRAAAAQDRDRDRAARLDAASGAAASAAEQVAQALTSPVVLPAEDPSPAEVVAAVELGEQGGTMPRPRRGRRWVYLGTAVVACGALVVGMIAVQSARSGASATAHAAWSDERLALSDEIARAQDLLVATDGQVNDERVRDELQVAITAALTAREDPTADAAGEPTTGQWRQAERAAIAASAVLGAAVNALERDHAGWQLGQATQAWDQARDELSATIDEATAVLAESADQVSDDAVRAALATAIDAATTARDVDVEADDVDGLKTVAQAAVDGTDALAGAVQSVRDAQAAWQAERAAGSQAPADAAQPARAGAPAKEAAAPATSQPAAAAPAGGGSTVTETWIRPGTIGCTTAAPYDFSVSASTGGVTGAVVVTIGGRSVTIGTGSGTFSGTLTSLPAGSYSWSVSADGLVVPGSNTVVVPCPGQ